MKEASELSFGMYSASSEAIKPLVLWCMIALTMDLWAKAESIGHTHLSLTTYYWGYSAAQGLERRQSHCTQLHSRISQAIPVI